jgi:hypothetical protein
MPATAGPGIGPRLASESRGDRRAHAVDTQRRRRPPHRRHGIGGHLTAATIRLAWHSDVHTRTGLAVLAAGTVIYVAGSMNAA